MKIAVLGTGTVGRIIAVKLSELGHEVIIGTRDTQDTLSITKSDNYGNPPFSEWLSDKKRITLETFAKATGQAELIFNCTSGMKSIAALQAAGASNLKGKVIIDIANPLDFSNGFPPSLTPTNTDSLGEQIQREFPESLVVKTLNTMTAGIMVNPAKVKGDHNVFMCGNDEHAKRQTADLLKSFGWSENQIIDLGDITNSRGTEMLLPIWLRLWKALGTADFNFHIQKN